MLDSGPSDEPSFEVDAVRARATRWFALLAAASVPVAGALAVLSHLPPRTVLAIVAVALFWAVVAAFATTRVSRPRLVRSVVAIALTAIPTCVGPIGDAAWNDAANLAVLVLFGTLVAYVDRRPILAAATGTALLRLAIDSFTPAGYDSGGRLSEALFTLFVLADCTVLLFTVSRMRAIVGTADVLTRRANRLRSAVDHATDAVAVIEIPASELHKPPRERERSVVYVNAALTALTGHDVDTLNLGGKSLLVAPRSAAVVGALDAAAARGETEQAAFTVRHRDGREIEVTGSIVAVADGDDATHRRIVSFRDASHAETIAEAVQRATQAEEREGELLLEIEARERSQTALWHAAHHDTLTGLANRALLAARMDELCAADARPALLFIDCDRFKRVNDVHGHGAGDALLVALAQRLATCVRDGDLLVRLGGDEFVVLLDRADEAVARGVAQRVLDAFASPFAIGGLRVEMSASVGVALGEPGCTAESLLRDADIAVYEAKSAGKARLTLLTPAMRQRASRALRVEADLRSAIEREEFDVHFQPVYGFERGRFVGCEALMRWQHPTLGMLSPAEFAPIAEETGLIRRIGEVVFAKVCGELRRLIDAGDVDAGFTASVNVSPTQLAEPGFAARVLAECARGEIEPRRLSLEISETVLRDELGAGAAALHALRDAGMRVLLEDFGTGFSSLASLHELPIDAIKIDRSFVSGRDDGIANRAVVRAVLGLARDLGVTVVAEGIETARQAGELESLGAAFGQGFHYARALDPGALALFLRARRDAAPLSPAGALAARHR